MLIQTDWFIVKIIGIPDEELFFEMTVRCTASYFVKFILYSYRFCHPSPLLKNVYCFICGRRRVAVAKYRMICRVLLIFVFFFNFEHAGTILRW